MKQIVSLRSLVLIGLFFLTDLAAIAQPTLNLSQTYVTGRLKRGFAMNLVWGWTGAAPVSDKSVIEWYSTTNSGSTLAFAGVVGTTSGTCTKIASLIAPTNGYFPATAQDNIFIYCVITPRDGAGPLGTPSIILPWSEPLVAGAPNHTLAAEITNYRSKPNTGAAGACSSGAPIISLTVGSVNACSGASATISRISFTDIGFNNAQTPYVTLSWGDGTANVDFLLTITNNKETAQFYQEFQTISPSHTYTASTTPSPLVTGTGGESRLCTYDRRIVQITIKNTATSAVEDQCLQALKSPVTIWDKLDDSRIGTFDISKNSGAGVEPSTLELDLCENDNSVFTLKDDSDFNCTNPREDETAGSPNKKSRWVQWVYAYKAGASFGTGSSASSTVTSVTIGATTYTSAQFPIYGPIVYLPESVVGPSAAENTPSIHLNNATVPQVLYVTLRSWNICNAYDSDETDGEGLNGSPDVSGPINIKTGTVLTGAGTVNGADNNPVELSYLIKTITKPTPPVSVDKNVCSGTVVNPAAAVCSAITAANQALSFEVNAASTATATAINWYFGDPASGGVLIVPTTYTYTPAGTCRFFRPADLLSTGGQGTMKTALAAGTPGNYTLYATQTTANGCESLGTPVTITIRNALSLATNPGASVASVCRTVGVTFTYPAGAPVAPPSQTFGGATQYTWTVPTNWTITSGQGTATMVATPTASAASGASSISVVWEYTTPTACTSGSKSVSVTVLDAPAITTQPATPTATCEGSGATFNVVATGAGLTFQWQEKVPAGSFVNISNGGNYSIASTATTSSLTVTPPDGTFNSNQYQVIVSGTCSPAVTSTARTLTVNTKPAITVQPTNKTVCAGSVATFGVTATATGISYQWRRDSGGGPVNIVAATDGAGTYTNFTTATLSVNTRFALNGFTYSVVVSGTCAPNATSASVTLNVKGPLTAITNGATSSVCTGNNLALTATETFPGLAGTVASRVWTGSVVPGGALTDPQLVTLFGGSPTSTLSPTFNAAATGVYTLTLTTTDTGIPACTSAATIVITVGAVSANPIPSPGTICSGATLSTINGQPSGGNGNFSGVGGHTWTGTGAVFLSATNVQSPTFNDNFNAGGAGTGIGGSFTLIYKATDTNGCSFTAPAITITVNPSPVLITPLSPTICSSVVTGVTLASDPANAIPSTTYNVLTKLPSPLAPNITQLSGALTVPQNGVANTYLSAENFRNNTNVDQIITYTVKPVGGGCTGQLNTINLTIKPEPRMATTLDATICSSTPIGLTLAVDPLVTAPATTASIAVSAANGYNIISRTVSGNLTQTSPVLAYTNNNGVPNNYLAGETFYNKTNVNQTVVYNVVPVTPGSCLAGGAAPGVAKVITITIAPEPRIATNAVIDKTVCSSVPINLTMAVDALVTAPATTASVTVSAVNGYNVLTRVIDPALTQIGAAAAIPGNGVANTYLLNETFRNNTNVAKTVTYDVVPVTAANCKPGGPAATVRTIVITINPEPRLASTLDATVCSTTSSIGLVLVEDPSITAPFTTPSVAVSAVNGFNVTGRVVNGNLTQLSGALVIPKNGNPNNYLAGETFYNKTNVNQTVTYNIVPVSAAGCLAGGAAPGVAKVVTMTIAPEPRMSTALDKTVCSNSATGLTLAVDPAITAPATTASATVSAVNGYNVISRTVDPFLVAVSQAAGPFPANGVANTYLSTEQYKNFQSTAKTVQYVVQPVGSGPTNCLGPMKTITVTINPEPVGASTPALITGAQCSSVAFTFSPQNSINNVVTGGGNTPGGGNSVASTFTWTAVYDGGSGNLTGGAASGSANITGTLVNKTAGPLNAVFTVTPTSIGGLCLGATFTMTVPINAESNVTAQPVDKTVCEAGATTFTVTATGPGITYKWQEKVGAGSFTNITDGTFGATYGGSATATLTISGALNAMNTNQYRVVMTTTGSCVVNSTARILTVNPLPVVAIGLVETRCSDAPGGTTTIMNLTLLNGDVTSPTAPYTYTWWKDAAATTTPIPPGSLGGQDQNYTVTNGDVLYARVHNVATGCEKVGTVNFTINTQPIANTITGPGAVCISTNLVFYQVTQNPGAKYSWTIPAGFTVAAGGGGATPGGGAGAYTTDFFVLLQFSSAVTQSISVTEKSAANCIGPVNSKPIAVAASPPLITIQSNPVATSFCKNQAGVVFEVPLGQFNPASNYIWSTDAGATIQGPTAGTGLRQILVQFNILPSATINVQEINVSGCPGTATPLVVSILDAPVMTPNTESICSGTNPSGTLLSASQPSTFAWVVKSFGGTGTITGAFVNDIGSGQITHFPPLKNVSGQNATITYTVTPTASGSPFCQGQPLDITVTVKPEPVVTSVVDQSFCPAAFATIPFSSNVGGAVMNWANSNPAIANPPLTATGSGTLSFIAAENLTGADITSTVTVTAVSGGCTSAGANAKTFIITIKPRPVVDPVANVEVCAGGSISSISFTSNTGGGETYSWTNDNTAIGLALNGTVNIPGYTAPANTTSAAFVGNILVTGKLNSCSGPTTPFTITVDPQPVISTLLDAAVCSGQQVGLTLNTNGSSIGAANYNIVSRTVSGGLVPVTTVSVPASIVAANYLLTEKYTNTTSSSLTVAYLVEAIGTINSCIGPQKTITMTIDPEPVISSSLNASVCSGSAIGLTLNTAPSSVAATTYNIISRTVPGTLTPVSTVTVPQANVAANYLITDKFQNLNNTSIGVTYLVEAKGSIHGCIGAQKLITIMIDPEPVVSTLLDASPCSGQSIGLVLNTNATSISAANYNIISRTLSPGGLTTISAAAVPANNVVDSYLSGDKFQNLTNTSIDVTYVVVPVGTINGCKGAQQSIVMHINPQPVIASGLDANACSGNATGLTLSTAGTSVAALNYNIISSTAAPALTVITQAPTALNVADNYLAADKFKNFTNASLTVVYVVEATGTINSCVGAQKTITITIDPEPIVAAGLDKNACSGTTSGLTLSTTALSVAASGYNISLASAIPAGLTPVAVATLPATAVTANYLATDKYKNVTAGSLVVHYSVQPIGITNGCLGAALTVNLTVDPEPVMATLGGPVCSNTPVGLTLNTNGTSIGAASYNIISRTVAGGLTSVATVTIPASGVADSYLSGEIFQNTTSTTKNVTYLVEPVGSINGCKGAQVSITMQINPEPIIANGLDNAVCSGSTTGLTLNTLGTSVAAANYNIISSTPAGGLVIVTQAPVAPGVAANYLAADKFSNTTGAPLSVVYVVEPVGTINSCVGAQKTITITINPEPILSATLDNNVCSGQVIGLTLATAGGSVAASGYNIISSTVPSVAGFSTVSAALIPATGVAVNYLSNDKYKNVTTGSLIVDYVVRPVSISNSCVGAPVTIHMTINPEPVVASGLDASACSDTAVGLTLNTDPSSIGALNYNIISRSVAGGLVSTLTVAVPATGVADSYLSGEIFQNTTTGDLAVTYLVEPVGTINGCKGAQKSITITINPEPVIANGLNGTLCSGNVTGLVLNTLASSVGAANYNIISSTPAPGLTIITQAAPASGVANNYLANDKFVNTTSTSLTVNYVVAAVGTGALCVGPQKTITMTIDPEPVVSTLLDNNICSGVAGGLVLNTNGTSVPALNYNIISRTSTGLTTVLAAVVPASNVSAIYLSGDKFKNTASTSSLPVVYKVVPVGAINSCVGAQQTITIMVDPEPVISTTLDAAVCSSQPIGLTFATNGTSVGAANYNIINRTISGGLTALSTVTVPATNVADNYAATDKFKNTTTGTLTVTYLIEPVGLVNNCVGAQKTITITINPEPVGSDLNDPVCASALNHDIQTQITSGLISVFTYTVTSNNGGVPAAPDRVIKSSANITDTYSNTTGTPAIITYLITPYNSASPSCAGAPFNYIVTISPTPILSAAPVEGPICSDIPFTITLQNHVTNGVTSTFTWTASYDAGLVVRTAGVSGNTVSETLTNTTTAPLFAHYLVSPSAGICAGTPLTISIEIDPEPVMSSGLDQIVCSQFVTGLTFSTTAGSAPVGNYNVTSITVDPGLVPAGSNVATANGVAAGYVSNDKFTNTGSVPLTVIYTVVPVSSASGACLGDPKNITVTVKPEPVLQVNTYPAICSTNSNTSNPVNIVFGTNGTSVNVAGTGYKLVQLQYSTGGPFAPGLPAGLIRNGGFAVGTSGDINLVKNDTYTNTSTNPITARYTIQGTSVGGCVSATQDYDVVINPQPQFMPTVAPLCSGVASGIVLTPTGTSTGISQYQLKTISLAGSLTAAGTNAAPGIYTSGNFLATDVFINTTAGPLSVTYTIAPSSTASCLGPDQTVVFTVNPAPGMPNLDTKACSGATSNIVLADNSPTSVSAVSYDINVITITGGMTPAGTNAGLGNTTNFNILKNDKFTNSTNVVHTVTYEVVPVASTSCKGPSTFIVLTVEPTIVAAPINNKATICSTSASTVDPTDIDLESPSIPSAPAVNPIIFSYTASATPPGSITGYAPASSGLSAGFHIADNLVNNTNAVASVTYQITAIATGASNGLGCSSVQAPITVTVEPKPKMTATPSTKTVCAGVSPNIALSSLTVPSGAIPIEFLLVTAVATNNNGVIGGISPNGTVFTNSSTLTDIYTSTSTTVETVTYTFRPRMAGGAGCIGDDVTVNININPRPAITATSVPTAICSGDQFDIGIVSNVANTVSSWPAPITSPTAGSVTGASAGAGDQIFQVLFNKTSPLVQTVTYIVTPQASGCAGTPLSIPIPVNPVPNVLGTATTTICNGTSLNVPLSSKVTSGVNFAWTVDDPSGLGAPGAFDGSGSTINQPFTNTTGAQAAITYTIVPTLTAPGTTTGTCVGDTKIMFVTVAPQISASFLNSPSPDYICKGNTEYLVFSFGGQAPFDFTYTVDQLSPASSTPHTLTNKGPVVVVQDVPGVATQYTYTITSVTSHVNGVSCTSPFSVPFVVNVGDTDPSFSIITPTASCSPNKTSFKYNQVAGTIYTWRFGDTGDSTYTATTTVPNMVIKHTYTNLSPSSTLTYPVSMQTELPSPYPGCQKSNAPQSISIYPQIIPNVLSDKTTICSGESIQFLNQSVGASSQNWSYRVQGQTAEIAMGSSTNITYAFTNTTTANPIIYEVIYRGNNGHCPTPDQIIPIQVYRSSVAGFNEGTLPPVINGHALVTFTNTSSIVDGSAFIYDWTFGADSHIGTGAEPASYSGTTPPTIDYTRPGTKDIVLTVTNNANALCKSTFTKTINLLLLPLVANFTAVPTESCAPTKVSIATVTATGDTYLWNVIDNNGRVVASSTGIQPTFNLSTEGNYLITFKTSSSLDGQSVSATPQTVKVYAKPFASFDARPDVVYIPDTELSTFNFSSGANQFAWDFGDGTIVDNANPPLSGDVIEPKHTYKIEGVFDILLTAQFDHGNNIVCQDTLSHQVMAKQGGITKVPNAFTPNPNGPSGGVAGNNSFNDVFLPIVKGVEEFNMQIYDRWGNLIFESNSSQIGWDGYDKNGKLMPASVYVYKLTLRLSDGQRSTQVGDVTMIR